MKKQYIFTEKEYNFIKTYIEQCHMNVYKQMSNNNDLDINYEAINLCSDLQLVLDVLNGYLELEDNE